MTEADCIAAPGHSSQSLYRKKRQFLSTAVFFKTYNYTQLSNIDFVIAKHVSFLSLSHNQ